MKDLLRKFKPESFRDLIALNAIYRPGPLQSGMTDEFVKCKHHPDRIKYELPEMEPILKETMGMIVYQEQVMRIATDIGGFSMAEADILRKAMGKKEKAIMKAQKKNFVAGAKSKGLNTTVASKIFEQIKYFAGYGFNKSHSTAYAYLAYQTAYLKTHYAENFLAALLTSEADRGATNQVVKYLNECRHMKIEILPPDINKSEFDFVVEGRDIRFGLSAVKNVGENAILSILKARKAREKFYSPFEIFEDVDSKTVNRKVIESLIKAGALDSMGWKRSQMFHLVDQIIDYSHELQRIRASKQAFLFGDGRIEAPPVPAEVKSMKEWDESQMLTYEKEAVGFYITGHPLMQFGNRLERLTSHLIIDLDENRDFSKEIKVAGIITAIKTMKTKKDERMATFFLEDLTGRIEIVVFPDAYKKYYDALNEDFMVWVKGKFLGEGESRRIHLTHLMPLVEALRKQAKQVVVKIYLPGIEKNVFETLKEILQKHEGECPIFFELETPHSSRVTMRSLEAQGVDPSDKLILDVEELLGEGSVLIHY